MLKNIISLASFVIFDSHIKQCVFWRRVSEAAPPRIKNNNVVVTMTRSNL